MKIKQITFTGADDTIEPTELMSMSKNLPSNIEWGILVSKSATGTNRFPTATWLKMLLFKIGGLNKDTNLCMHICGHWVREICKGKFELTKKATPIAYIFWDAFKRVQLNFHSYIHEIDEPRFTELIEIFDKQWIFQLDDVNNDLLFRAVNNNINAVPLFDVSGGAGTVPEEWPKPIENLYCGYAGGLGPHNLKEELLLIEEEVEDGTIWIDMETHIRDYDTDKFDLKKVEECVRIAEPWLI